MAKNPLKNPPKEAVSQAMEIIEANGETWRYERPGYTGQDLSLPLDPSLANTIGVPAQKFGHVLRNRLEYQLGSDMPIRLNDGRVVNRLVVDQINAVWIERALAGDMMAIKLMVDFIVPKQQENQLITVESLVKCLRNEKK